MSERTGSMELFFPRSLRDPLLREEGTWSSILLLALAFLLPLWPTALPALTAAIVVVRLVTRVRWMERPLLRIDLRLPAFGAVLLLLVHIAGMVWTSNTDFGWFDVSIKLPLLLFPLFALLPGAPRDGRDAVLGTFCLGNVVAVLLCVGAAVLRSFGAAGVGASQFLSSRFSIFLHPSYFALYLSIGLAVWFLGDLHSRYRSWLAWTIVGSLAVGVVLTESRMGWIVLPAVLVWSLVHHWRSPAIRRPLVAVLSLCAVGAFLLIVVSPGVRYRVQEVFTASSQEVAVDASSSASVRVLVWRAAREVAVENAPLGTGTGDVKDELIANYERSGYSFAAEHRLNAHNQFLQTAAALGVPGVLSMLLMLLVPLVFALRGGDPCSRAVHMCVLLVLIMNWSVESMLETQAGALFTGFLLWVLWWPTASTPSSRS